MSASEPLTRRGVVLGAGALAACSRPALSRWPRLRIGYQKNGVLLLAKARAQLAERLGSAGTTDVSWAEFGSGPPLLEAMRAGAVDFGGVGDTPPIFAQVAGSPLVYAAAQPLTGAGQGLLVPASSPARSIADLKGRRIGLTKGSSAHLFVLRLLQKAGLPPDAAGLVFLSPADASAAFTSGALDAWAIWDPYMAIAEASGRARLLVDGRAVAPTNSFYLASRRFAEEAPRVLAALLDALAIEAAWGNTHPGECAHIVAAATGLPAAVVATSLRRGPFAVQPMSDAVIGAQQANADLLLRSGVIPGPVDVRAAAWRGWTPALLPPDLPKE